MTCAVSRCCKLRSVAFFCLVVYFFVSNHEVSSSCADTKLSSVLRAPGLLTASTTERVSLKGLCVFFLLVCECVHHFLRVLCDQNVWEAVVKIMSAFLRHGKERRAFLGRGGVDSALTASTLGLPEGFVCVCSAWVFVCALIPKSPM